MKEWIYDLQKDNYYHRHQSHIYPLFPGNEITKESNPVIYEALKTAVDKRLMIGFVQQTGWSYAHMANIYARLEDGQNALACLNYILRSCTGSNLFTYHNDWRDQGLTLYWFGKMPPFQIDANLGFTAAMIEMLIFSKDGFLRILPALPQAWNKGKLLNISTRCGIKCDIIWQDKIVNLYMSSYDDQTVIIELPYIPEELEFKDCEGILVKEENGHSYYSVSLKKDIKGSLFIK